MVIHFRHRLHTGEDDQLEVGTAERRPLRQPIEERLAEPFAAVRGEEFVLVDEVRIERGAVDRRPLGDVLDSDGVEALFGEQFEQGVLQQFAGAFDAWVSFVDCRHG